MFFWFFNPKIMAIKAKPFGHDKKWQKKNEKGIQKASRQIEKRQM